MTAPAATPRFRALADGRVFVALLAAFCLAFAAIRLLWGATFTADEALEIVWSQTLQPGYSMRQPPLYAWLLHAGTTAFGLSPAIIVALKYGLIFAFGLATYALARRILNDPSLAALAVGSYALIYQIGWEMHQNYTQTTLLLVMFPASLLAAMRLVEAPSVGRAALLGLAVGLGLLSKHSYIAFLAVMALALLPLRARFRLIDVVIAAIVAVAVYAPYGAFFLANQGDLLRETEATMAYGGVDGWLDGLWLAALAIVLSLAPLVPMLPALFPAVVWRGGARAGDGAAFAAVILRMAAVGTAIVVGGALLGFSGFQDRHLMVFYNLVPIALLSRVEGATPDARRLRLLVVLIAAVIAVAAAVRLAEALLPGRPLCNPACIRYKALSGVEEALRAAGAGPTATVIAERPDLAAMARLAAPGRRVLTKNMVRPPPAGATQAGCVLLWVSDAAGRGAQSDWPAPETVRPRAGATPIVLDARHRRSFGGPWVAAYWNALPLEETSPACR